jgi:hypothetical protein
MDVQFCVDWVPGQGVRMDYYAIIELLIQQLDPQRVCRLALSIMWLIPSQTAKYNSPLPYSGLQNY